MSVSGSLGFGDRDLTVRDARADDAAALRDLFESLDDDDRHSRFFCAFHPPENFCRDQVTVADRGGARLVAIESRGNGDGYLVAEAGYSLLPSGAGELSITVRRAWRGWLGAYLLDLLCDVASASGVRNIEADVLLINEPMLSLLRARGAAVVEHDGYYTVRLRIATVGPRPTWDGVEHPRVLIEAPGARWHGETLARAAGAHMISCNGPSSGRRGCPALRGEACPLAAGADAIVVSPPRDDPAWAALLAAHAQVHPGVPVHVEAEGGRDIEAIVNAVTRPRRSDQRPCSEPSAAVILEAGRADPGGP